MRREIAAAKCIVVKIGSALLTDLETGLAHEQLAAWCDQIHKLIEQGRRVLLVSSGAVAEGVNRLNLGSRPSSVHELQAAAAVGQMGLIHAYERAFAANGVLTALVLLTHDDLADRQRYLNARATLTTLLDLGVVPVVNENDSVVTDEIRFGDNDTLAALVANLLQADLMIVLTDTDGLHEADPRESPTAPIVPFADASDERLDSMAGIGASTLGRGGMITKVQAARLAARSGSHTVIANGREMNVLTRILTGEHLGTLLAASVTPLDARKRWIAGQLKAKGELRLDPGAVDALRRKGVSLLPVGVVAVQGEFVRGDMVRCVDETGGLVAQGLANYGSVDAAKLIGARTDEIGERLGYRLEPELVHRDNLVLLSG
ncbi:MAG: glutamate 5-kinase [Gammaproteobacteria bacterium]|nr:glutamate 5-kinase [Gammaproteobacteria bacterium]